MQRALELLVRPRCAGDHAVAVAVAHLPRLSVTYLAGSYPSSLSLAVRNLAAPRAIYKKPGFQAIDGNAAHHRLILRHGDAIIGLFHEMLVSLGNALTFNPGWRSHAKPLAKFTDTREIQHVELMNAPQRS